MRRGPWPLRQRGQKAPVLRRGGIMAGFGSDNNGGGGFGEKDGYDMAVIMNIEISPATLRILKSRMKRGGYESPDAAVRAGLAYLEQQENAIDFEPGELDRLLAVADVEMAKGETLDGEASFRNRKRRRR